MRILVCGGRDFNDQVLFNSIMAPYKSPDTAIIQGNARGADTMAYWWALMNAGAEEHYDANWDLHGKKAGVLRNIKMLQEGKPDLVIAFPGGTGTAHMVKIAREAGVKVIEVDAPKE